jgi:hypothetical protein
MALIIISTQNNPIHVQGTSIELTSVYTRLEYSCRPDGVTIEIAFYTYADYAGYLVASYLPTDLPLSNLTQDIDILTQIQDLSTVHDIAKANLESRGYIVTIDLA